jgi:hypothetical protein
MSDTPETGSLLVLVTPAVFVLGILFVFIRIFVVVVDVFLVFIVVVVGEFEFERGIAGDADQGAAFGAGQLVTDIDVHLVEIDF